MGNKPAIHRISIALDIEHYAARTAYERSDAQERLLWTAVNFLRAAGVKPGKCVRQDEGDGQLILLPSDVDVARALPTSVMALECALRRLNATPGSAGRIRMRAAMAQGPVQEGRTGYVGFGVVETSRLVNSDAVRAGLNDNPAVSLAVIVSDDLYRQVFAQGYGPPRANEFRSVTASVDAKGYTSSAWRYVPPANLTTTLVPPYAPVRGMAWDTALRTAIPVAGAAVGGWLVGSHQQHTVPHPIPNGQTHVAAAPRLDHQLTTDPDHSGHHDLLGHAVAHHEPGHDPSGYATE